MDNGADINLMLAILVGAAVLAMAVKLVWGLVNRRAKTGYRVGAEMTNTRAVVVAWAGHEGTVRADGELWRAMAKAPLREGDKVRVVAVDGLRLLVKQQTD